MQEVIVRVKNKEQLAAVIDRSDVAGLILESGAFHVPETGKKIWAALPDVAREKKLEPIEKMIDKGRNYGFLVRNFDELEMLKGYEGPVIGDSFLYAYNAEAIAFYRSLFPQMEFIAPDELTDSEMESLEQAAGIEFIYKVYGYQQLMITNQCMNRNYFACQEPCVKFSDDKGNDFYMTSECGQCLDIVYNGLPTSMLDKDVRRSKILYDFTLESAAEVTRILDEGSSAVKSYTRGHHYKGID